MQSAKALLAGLSFLALALSGCSSGGDDGGFSIKHGSGQTYTFTASGSADNYTWDLGDRLTLLHGKSVTHTYDFANGKVNVLLTMKKGEAKTEHRKELVLGTGLNEEATFILEGATNWTVTGEAFRLSAAASSDPDGDALRYSWSCVRTGDAVKTTPHSHGFGGGIDYATPPAGSVTARLATAALPEPDRIVEGDLCETLGAGGRPSLASTIEGTFTNTGIYDIYLLASDPVHPSTSGKFHFVVTKPEERPEATLTFPFENTFQGGFGGTGSDLCVQAQQENCETYDFASHTFSIPLEGLAGTVLVEETADATTQGTLSWVLFRGSTQIAAGAGGDSVMLAAADLKLGSYHLDVTLDQGLDVSYAATVTVDLDKDPFKYY